MVTTARRTVAKSIPWETVFAVFKLTTTLLAVYWLAIFVATHLPGSSLPSLGSDKVYHLLAFSGLSFLLMWVMSQKLTSVALQVALVLTLAIVYGCVDEWSQQFVAGRQPDLADAVADACGAVVGVLCFLALRALGWSLFRPARWEA